MQRFLFVLMALALSCGTAWADHPDTKSEIENLKERIHALEAEIKPLPAGESQFNLQALGKYLTISGLLELQANYSKTRSEDATSDLTLATAQLATEVTINDHIGGHLVLLYEEEPGEDALNVDEAVISLHCPRALAGQTPSFYGGKMYVPFGKFNSSMITDPLTLDLGETNDTAAVIGLEGKLWNFRTGVFNGEVDSGNDTIDSFVAALELTPAEGVSFGASYISDLAESDIELVADSTLYSSSVPATSAFASLSFGKVSLDAEIVATLDDFDTILVGSTDLTGQRPLAWNLEVAWVPKEALQLAARIEGAKDFQDDVTRYGATVSYGLFAHTVVAIEYLFSDFDSEADNQALTAQLAFDF